MPRVSRTTASGGRSASEPRIAAKGGRSSETGAATDAKEAEPLARMWVGMTSPAVWQELVQQQQRWLLDWWLGALSGALRPDRLLGRRNGATTLPQATSFRISCVGPADVAVGKRRTPETPNPEPGAIPSPEKASSRDGKKSTRKKTA